MKTRAVLWLVVVALVGFGAARFLQRPPPPASVPPVQAAVSPAPVAASTPSTVSNPSTPSTPPPAPLWTRLTSGAPTPDDLAELRHTLLTGDPRASIAAIRAYLATGQDAPTGEAFTIGEGGSLAGAPTVRVLLLDLLGQLSARTGGDEAARAGREILTAKTSPDEWAVSLRNVGQHEPAATAYLAAKAREMLTYAPWQSAPTGGFLEAFDVPVFAADGSFAPTFVELSRQGAEPLQRAAKVALDRLSEANPVAVMSYLNGHPSELADRPFLRADYYGKADLSDPAQRSAIEFYLTRQDVTVAEKAKLIASLAAPASFISEALLSAPAVRPESPARERAVPATLQAWIKEARFTDLRPVLQKTLQKLGP